MKMQKVYVRILMKKLNPMLQSNYIRIKDLKISLYFYTRIIRNEDYIKNRKSHLIYIIFSSMPKDVNNDNVPDEKIKEYMDILSKSYVRVNTMELGY